MQHYALSADYQVQNKIGSEGNKSNSKPFLSSVKASIWILSFMLLSSNFASATSIWQGGISSNWNTAGNWNGGVPDLNDAVDIPEVTPPNVYPVITSAALAKNVTIHPAASLTIAVSGTLSISGSPGRGLDSEGTLTNRGTLSINNTARDGMLIREGSLFTNFGTLDIGNTGNIGYSGIGNFGGTIVNDGGTISVNQTGTVSDCGILNQSSFTNKGNISIGGLAGEVQTAIGFLNSGASANFVNESSGNLSVNRTALDGIRNNSAGTITNKGAIRVGVAGGIGDNAIDNNNATFNNSTCSAYINLASDNTIVNTGMSASFSNVGIIIENASGNSSINSNTGVVQNLNGGAFNVGSGSVPISTIGQIWTGCSSTGWSSAANWHNATVPTTADDVIIRDAVTDPIISSASSVAKSVMILPGAGLTIATTGTLTINGSVSEGVFNQGTVTNNGLLKIGITTGTGSYGIRNEGTFNNNLGTLSIDKASQAALYNVSGTFTNSASLSLKTAIVAPYLVNSLAGTISNSVTGTLSGTGLINPTHFTNAGGILSPGYSPGILTFNGDENFSNSTMAIEVNGTGVAGTAYDQVVVNGNATLGGTLALSFNFPNAISGDLVKILDATSLTGTFSAVTGLPVGWTIHYNTPNHGEVSLAYQVALPVNLVRFTAKSIDSKVKLDWQTSTETNNQGFDIERRPDNGDWQKIGFVDGNGSTTASKTYSFLDQNPLYGMNYYRLRQLDFNGDFEYSRIVAVKMDSEKLVKIYPNPTTGILNIEGAQSGVKIFDAFGRLVGKGLLVNQKIDISNLPGGLYIISVSSEKKEKSISIVKQ